MEDSPDKHETPLHTDLGEARLLALRQEFAEASSSPSFVHTLLYTGEHGETLAVFLNQNSTWLMYRRHEDDSWLSARNPSYTGPRKQTYRYPLGNERWDEFPACGSISPDEALRVTEYFLRTGEKAPWLTWHTDLLEDEYDDTARLKTLEQEFAIARTSEPGVLWYERNSGEILNAFVNGDRAWLMYRRNEEDAGFSTHNPAYTGPKNATLPYVLDNGQRDEFPVALTIATNEAIRAVMHFLHTGEKAPWLAWHDNSQAETEL